MVNILNKESGNLTRGHIRDDGYVFTGYRKNEDGIIRETWSSPEVHARRSEKHKRYREKHIEMLRPIWRERAKKFKKENPERLKEIERKSGRKYYYSDLDKSRARARENTKKYNEKNRESVLKKAVDYGKKKRESKNPQVIASILITRARRRAQKKKIPFDLTAEFVAEKIAKGKCEVTGIEFVFDKRKESHGSPFFPSIDRISSADGYTQNNIQIVVYIYNLAKSDFTHQDVITLALALNNQPTN